MLNAPSADSDPHQKVMDPEHWFLKNDPDNSIKWRDQYRKMTS